MHKSNAFTLIELLIVVAIIAILAAIALPNLLDAQVRAKVAREKSDMRALAVALESYAADNNKYPPHGEQLSTGTINFPASAAGLNTVEFLSPILTTPIAYLTHLPNDPFLQRESGSLHKFQYGYIESDLMRGILLGKGFTSSAQALIPTYGHWRLYAAGPDTDKGRDVKTNVFYDPTNGTVSNGDLARSQRDTVLRLAEDE